MTSYNFSEEIDPDIAKAQGCFTTLPIRVHRDKQAAEEASQRLVAEWENKMKGGHKADSIASFGPNGHLVALSIPECLPERLELVTYVTDFMFFHDDFTESVDFSEANREHADLSETFHLRNGTWPNTPKSQFQAQLVRDLIEVDEESAITFLEEWKKFLHVIDRSTGDFKTFEEYLPCRTENGGGFWYLQLCCYGMNIKLTEEEKHLASAIVRPALVSGILTNDYYSWEKEFQAYQDGKLTRPMNAVFILMGQYGVSADQAKELLKAKIIDFEREYSRSRNKLEIEGLQISQNLLKYIMAAGLFASGHSLWCTSAPRYHQEKA
jgi:hypothetical protein